MNLTLKSSEDVKRVIYQPTPRNRDEASHNSKSEHEPTKDSKHLEANNVRTASKLTPTAPPSYDDIDFTQDR